MQLPIVLEMKVIDSPVALRAIMNKRVLDYSRAVRFGDLQRVVGAEGIDHMNVIGDAARGFKSVANREFGIERQDDYGNLEGLAR
jgi:hypothetical protein